MSKLLHISGSPRGTDAESLRVAEVFLDAYRDAHPGDTIEHWDLWDGSLPGFAVGAKAKMTVFSGAEPQGEEGEAWNAARRVFERFDAADRLLFSLPMWNHSVPYVVKQFIDVVSQPGWVFGFDAEKGYTGLLAGRGKKAAVLSTSAVWAPGLPPSFGTNFMSPYFTDWLHWTGIDDVTEIGFHPTVTGDWDAARADVDARARELAKGF
ncbi:FMN-dependent NADH-azoreductase [Actinorhabdospora filicis]|uniref:FMN dependent NADH:quinone oxidoreductase n=1 Tax=Actinorhabdospora filicis TaxID=1785913 RepID=A0A9W6ST02_9ACTN|nr:NAD(P)H-dependent oxidoreductase [Actinorhabdospora filicis]GLZ81287.1 FMN-dependent NADH-azoreductase [Actinorhabdospora filicis]